MAITHFFLFIPFWFSWFLLATKQTTNYSLYATLLGSVIVPVIKPLFIVTELSWIALLINDREQPVLAYNRVEVFLAILFYGFYAVFIAGSIEADWRKAILYYDPEVRAEYERY